MAIAFGFTQESIPISVTDPRPVAAAVAQLEKHFGRVITYEDTRYVHPSDIVDVTDQYSRNPDKSKRLLVMRTGNIQLVVTSQAAPVETRISDALAQVLEQSKAAGNTGEFRVDRRIGAHHVVPVAFKGSAGAMEAQTPLLDTPITIDGGDTTAQEAIARITAAVSEATGIRVLIGMLPFTMPVRIPVTTDARNERARDVLWRVLQTIRPDLSWRLLCDVGERGSCALNIHRLPQLLPMADRDASFEK